MCLDHELSKYGLRFSLEVKAIFRIFNFSIFHSALIPLQKRHLAVEKRVRAQRVFAWVLFSKYFFSPIIVLKYFLKEVSWRKNTDFLKKALFLLLFYQFGRYMSLNKKSH